MNEALAHQVERAEAALRTGEVVTIPTDTVYGLAVCPLVPGAIERLFALKERPRGHSIPVLVSDFEQAMEVGELQGAETIATKFWPGALTLVVKRRPDWLPIDLGAATATVALRVPAHRVARELCRRVGPLAVTSANRHGEAAAWNASEVDLAGVALVVDGGPGDGVASTIIDLTVAPPRELRPGPIPYDVVVALWG